MMVSALRVLPEIEISTFRDPVTPSVTSKQIKEIQFLFFAATGHLHGVLDCIASGVDLKSRCSNQVDRLLAHNPRPYSAINNETALHLACQYGHESVVLAIISATVQQAAGDKKRISSVLDATTSFKDKTALHLAAECKRISAICFRALIEAGANIMKKDADGRSALIYLSLQIYESSYEKFFVLLSKVTEITQGIELKAFKANIKANISAACNLIEPLVNIITEYCPFIHCPEYVNEQNDHYYSPLRYISRNWSNSETEECDKQCTAVSELLLEAGATPVETNHMKLYKKRICGCTIL